MCKAKGCIGRFHKGFISSFSRLIKTSLLGGREVLYLVQYISNDCLIQRTYSLFTYTPLDLHIHKGTRHLIFQQGDTRMRWGGNKHYPSRPKLRFAQYPFNGPKRTRADAFPPRKDSLENTCQTFHTCSTERATTWVLSSHYPRLVLPKWEHIPWVSPGEFIRLRCNT